MKIDLKNCTLFIRQTTVSATAPLEADQGNFMIVKFGEGTFNFTIHKNMTYELDRGKLDDVRHGDEAPIDVSFGGKYESIMSAPAVSNPAIPALRSLYRNQLTIPEALRGKMFDGVTTHPWNNVNLERENWLTCTPYCVALELHNDLRRECPDTTALGEALLFRYFRAESIDPDMKAGTLSVTGKANILRPMALSPGSANWLYGVDPGDIPLPFLKGSGTWNWPPDLREI